MSHVLSSQRESGIDEWAVYSRYPNARVLPAASLLACLLCAQETAHNIECLMDEDGRDDDRDFARQPLLPPRGGIF